MSKDVEQIKKAVNAYISGVTTRRIEKFLESWHPDSRMSSMRDGTVSIVPRSFWEEWCQKPSEDKVVSSEIKSIDFTGTVAMAKVEVVRESAEGSRVLTDYLTLLRVNGNKWEIMNKSFHAESIAK
ncbi:MAG: nuclear transport factor 2 family protein [Candidatus Thorarchaeota archaeon]